MNEYPTKSQIKKIKKFKGTPEQFIDYIGSLWNPTGLIKIEDCVNDFGPPEKFVTLITGGWSGCELVVEVVSKTMFSLFFHSKWERGGLYEYRVPAIQWSTLDMHLGYMKYMGTE